MNGSKKNYHRHRRRVMNTLTASFDDDDEKEEEDEEEEEDTISPYAEERVHSALPMFYYNGSDDAFSSSEEEEGEKEDEEDFCFSSCGDERGDDEEEENGDGYREGEGGDIWYYVDGMSDHRPREMVEAGSATETRTGMSAGGIGMAGYEHWGRCEVDGVQQEDVLFDYQGEEYHRAQRQSKDSYSEEEEEEHHGEREEGRGEQSGCTINRNIGSSLKNRVEYNQKNSNQHPSRSVEEIMERQELFRIRTLSKYFMRLTSLTNNDRLIHKVKYWTRYCACNQIVTDCLAALTTLNTYP